MLKQTNQREREMKKRLDINGLGWLFFLNHIILLDIIGTYIVVNFN